MNWRSVPPVCLGLRGGRLAACPDRNNCVSTYSQRPQQAMVPIPLDRSADEALRELESVLRSLPRSRIVTVDREYLQAEFRSLVFGFVDDVEFLIDESQGQIHFRSASRIGASDLGVNRRRMQEIRRRYGVHRQREHGGQEL
jgi:uncharacterized protein (DUF1499 family)